MGEMTKKRLRVAQAKESVRHITDMVERAAAFAAFLSDGHFNKKSGEPDIVHFRAVAAKLNTPEKQAAGLMHDLIEDYGVTKEDLLELGFPFVVAESVVAVSRRPDETYDEFIERIDGIAELAVWDVSNDVKRSDLGNNRDLTRIESPTDKDFARKAKYDRALAKLLSSWMARMWFPQAATKYLGVQKHMNALFDQDGFHFPSEKDFFDKVTEFLWDDFVTDSALSQDDAENLLDAVFNATEHRVYAAAEAQVLHAAENTIWIDRRTSR